MKKIILSLLLLVCLCGFVACNKDPKPTEDPAEGPSSTEIMDAFLAAKDDDVVTVKGYVAAKQSWWSNKATIYLLDENSLGYFVYELSCTEDQYNIDLKIGNYVEVTGVKGSYHGEVEIMGQSGDGATYKVLEGTKTDFAAKTLKLSGLTSDLINAYVKCENLTVVGLDLAKSETGGDLYITVADDTASVTLCVESYLTAKGTDVYTVASSLVLGDKVTFSGFLYWYDGANPHVTSMTKVASSEDAAIREAFNSANNDDVVTVKGYVAAKQSWWSNKATIYLLDNNSEGYFVYNLSCTEDQYNTDLKIGNYVEVTGVKGAYKGEVEIMGQSGDGATYKVVSYSSHSFVAKELTLAGLTEDLINAYVSVKDLEVVSVDLSKVETGGDIYIDCKDSTGAIVKLCVESYLTAKGTDVYTTASGLVAGDKISFTGFLYWYDGPNPHVTALTK